METLEFFKKELDNQIKIFDDESTKHKKLYRRIRYFIFGFTGLSTLLAGIAIGSENIQQYLNIGVVVLTAGIGIASSIEGLRKPSELWIMERNQYHALKDLKRSFEFDLANNINDVNVKDYFDRMQILLSSVGKKWNKNIVKRSPIKNKLPK